MPSIRLEIIIKAPVAICFDLSRSIDVHQISTNQTNETAIAGRVTGLIEQGETVTWQAKHFGIQQTLTSKITRMEPPIFFEDEMVDGAFKSIRHEHHFATVNGSTKMTDLFVFESPLGILGKIANKLFLTRYMTRLLIKRNEVIKEIAELNAINKQNN